jgi:hypothetical protein
MGVRSNDIFVAVLNRVVNELSVDMPDKISNACTFLIHSICHSAQGALSNILTPQANLSYFSYFFFHIIWTGSPSKWFTCLIISSIGATGMLLFPFSQFNVSLKVGYAALRQVVYDEWHL